MLFVRNGYDIVKELYVDEGSAVSGKFNTFKDHNLGDLDARKGASTNFQKYQRFNEERY